MKHYSNRASKAAYSNS